MKSFKLHFKGHYLYDYLLKQYNDPYRNNADYAELKIPGICCVYTGEFVEGDKIKPNRLIYIDEAESIYHKLVNKNLLTEFIKHVSGNERLLISFAEVTDAEDRKRVKSAMVSKYRPICNVASNITFDSPTELILSGEIELLDAHFIV